MSKLLGYILIALGLVSAAFTIPPIKKVIPFQLPAVITPLYLTIAAIVLLFIGLFMLGKGGGSSSKQPAEVPIYHGKNVVGFRRVK